MGALCCGKKSEKTKPKSAKKARYVFPHIGIMGWIALALQAAKSAYELLMLGNLAEFNALVVYVLFVCLPVLLFVLLMINAFVFAPHYQDKKNDSDSVRFHDSIKAKAKHSYMKEDTTFGNDQSQISGALFRNTILVLLVGLFFGRFGLWNILALPLVYSADMCTYFAITKLILVLSICSTGASFTLFVFDTKSDFTLRQHSAIHSHLNGDDEDTKDGSQSKKGVKNHTPSSSLSGLGGK